MSDLPPESGTDKRGEPEDSNGDHNPLAMGLALLVIVVLLLGTWFVINQLQCNPLFSDAGLNHSRACR